MTSWYRWPTLVMVAHLFLVVTIAAERAGPVPAEMTPLTHNEVWHLFIRLVIVPTRHLVSHCLIPRSITRAEPAP